VSQFKIAKESLHIHDGHHFFVDKKGQLIISDHSIDAHTPLSPANADDGILYVDFNRPLKQADDGYFMPLIDSQGDMSHTIVSLTDALFAQHHMDKVFAVGL
jgi:hypothetical protein